MKKYFIIATIVLLAAGCAKQPQYQVINYPTPTPAVSPVPASASTSTAMSLPVQYNNTQYGFIFSLPQDWTGYTILSQVWVGHELTGNLQSVQGPKIIIRNPLWTKARPYEDIPILVFTPDEWNQIQAENLSVSAAPIPPSELGSNAKYIFALPARYNFDFAAGFQEVEQIMQNNPLQGY